MLQKKSDRDDPILCERLRQARLSFNLVLAVTAIMAVVDVGLLINKQFGAAAAMTTGGISVSACCFKLAKDAGDRLDKLVDEDS